MDIDNIYTINYNNNQPICYHLITGWRTEFYTAPKSCEITEIVHGPFRRHHQLVKTRAFAHVKMCSCSQLSDEIENYGKIYHDIPFVTNSAKTIALRAGIPDPWVEVLVFKSLNNNNNNNSKYTIIDKIDYENWSDNLAITEKLFQKYGVVFTQGIPDPWMCWPRMNKKLLINNIELPKSPTKHTTTTAAVIETASVGAIIKLSKNFQYEKTYPADKDNQINDYDKNTIETNIENKQYSSRRQTVKRKRKQKR